MSGGFRETDRGTMSTVGVDEDSGVREEYERDKEIKQNTLKGEFAVNRLR